MFCLYHTYILMLLERQNVMTYVVALTFLRFKHVNSIAYNIHLFGSRMFVYETHHSSHETSESIYLCVVKMRRLIGKALQSIGNNGNVRAGRCAPDGL